MALISAYVDQADLGNGLLQNTINMKPVAYLQGGSYRAMDQSWTDSGDSTRPHIVTAAPLMVSAGNDGMRRFHPTRDLGKYIELGAPYVQVGGVWTQVNLGTPTRTGKTLLWQTANADFTVNFGGHFCDLDIELKGGYVPQNSRVAFPVGISGLTRSGTAILDGSNVVANLRPFQMYDAANPDDRRDITHQFTTLNGNPYLLLTLPSLTGMTRPVIDPTLSLQPDATAGIDTSIIAGSPNSNRNTLELNIGERFGASILMRTLIKFDLSALPSAATISSATLSLYANFDGSNNSRDFRVYRQKKAWTEARATWNKYDGTNNWTTAGGFDGADCEQTDIGFRTLSASETINVFKDFALTPTTKAGLDLGNGWLVKADTESDDEYQFVDSDSATAANRPKLVVVYTLPSSGRSFFVAPFQAPLASGVFG